MAALWIPHRPELACSAMCEFWWNWVMLRTIPSKVCINVLTSPCSLYTFWFNGDDRTSFKAIGTPWSVRVVCKWSHSIIYPIYYKSTLYDNQKWCSNLKSSILQLYMTSRHNDLFWNVRISQLHFYTDTQAGQLSLLCAMVQLYKDNYDPNSNFPPKFKWLFPKY